MTYSTPIDELNRLRTFSNSETFSNSRIHPGPPDIRNFEFATSAVPTCQSWIPIGDWLITLVARYAAWRYQGRKLALTGFRIRCILVITSFGKCWKSSKKTVQSETCPLRCLQAPLQEMLWYLHLVHAPLIVNQEHEGRQIIDPPAMIGTVAVAVEVDMIGMDQTVVIIVSEEGTGMVDIPPHDTSKLHVK